MNPDTVDTKFGDCPRAICELCDRDIFLYDRGITGEGERWFHWHNQNIFCDPGTQTRMASPVVPPTDQQINAALKELQEEFG